MKTPTQRIARVAFGVLSPTWALATHLRLHQANDKAHFIRFWSWTFFGVAVASWAGAAYAQDNNWYAIDQYSKECMRGSPSQAIIGQQNLNLPYKAKDITDPASGIVVETTVTLPQLGGSVTFYRGLARCEAASDAIKEERDRAKRETIEKYGDLSPAQVFPTIYNSPPTEYTIDRFRHEFEKPGALSPSELTPADRATLNDHVRKCWFSGSNHPFTKAGMAVDLRISADSGGVAKTADIEIGEEEKLTDTDFRNFVNQVRNTVLSPQCARLPLPENVMGKPSVVIFLFTP